MLQLALCVRINTGVIMSTSKEASHLNPEPCMFDYDTEFALAFMRDNKSPPVLRIVEQVLIDQWMRLIARSVLYGY